MWFHRSLSDTISVYFVRPRTCSAVAATGGAEHSSALHCYRHGSSRAELMLHCFSLTSGILSSFTILVTLPIQVGSNTSLHSSSPCFLFVVLQMILFIYNELLHLICQDFEIRTCFLAVHFQYLRTFLFILILKVTTFSFFLLNSRWLTVLLGFISSYKFLFLWCWCNKPW